MKKIFLLLFATTLLCSCKTTMYQTAATDEVSSNIKAVVVADLDVSNEKITYTLVPDRFVRRGGLRNCINVAINEALRQNGNADVLLETQNAIVVRSGLFGRKIRSVTVTGYPARYKNFQSMDKDAVKEMMSSKVYITNKN